MIEAVLEILKFTIPSLVVFGTVYFLVTRYLNQQYNLKSLEVKESQLSVSMPMKLQAYERLVLLCERISPPNLYLRMRTTDTSIKDIKHSMVLAIQQEYEHNLTQQIYVSESLWKIITLAKDQTVEIITQIADKSYHSEDTSNFLDKYNRVLRELKVTPLDQAKSAIKKEINILF